MFNSFKFNSAKYNSSIAIKAAAVIALAGKAIMLSSNDKTVYLGTNPKTLSSKSNITNTAYLSSN